MKHIPRKNEFFTGRADELEKLRAALTGSGSAAVTQAIAGLGGVGKTALSVEYAHRYYDDYQAIFFVNASSAGALAGDYFKMAGQLGICGDGTDFEVSVQAFRRWLSENSDYLLVLDNADITVDYAEDLEAYLPDRLQGHILITSRAQMFKGNLGVKPENILRLDVLEPADAFMLLKVRRYGSNASLSDAETAAITELAGELGYLALALEQAAAYVVAQQTTFINYLVLYRAAPIPQLEQGQPETGGYSKSVATTWQLSFDQVSKVSPASADLLTLSAFLAPDAIPYELIFAFGKFGAIDGLQTLIGNIRDEAVIPEYCNSLLAPLHRYSLIEKDIEEETFSVHRLVQEVRRFQLDSHHTKIWIQRVTNTLSLAFPSPSFINWSYCYRLIDHARTLADRLGDYGIFSTAAGLLFNKSGNYCTMQGQFQESEYLLKQSLTHCKATLPSDHQEIASSLNSLGILFKTQGRFTEAKPLYDEALAINRRILAPTSPIIATSVNNIGSLYLEMGDLIQAEKHYKEALDLHKNSVPRMPNEVAIVMSNLGTLYILLGRYSEAVSMLNDALQIKREICSPNDPDLGISIDNLAMAHKEQGNYTESERLYLEAFHLFEQNLPYKHPYRATNRNGLAEVYRVQERYDEAEPLYLEALSINRDTLPTTHSSIASNLGNLGLLYQSQGRYQEAESHLKEALTLRRIGLPVYHRDTGNNVNSLAALYYTLGRFDEAGQLYEDALDILSTYLDLKHPRLLTTLNNYIALAAACGKTSSVHEFLQRRPEFSVTLQLLREMQESEANNSSQA